MNIYHLLKIFVDQKAGFIRIFFIKAYSLIFCLIFRTVEYLIATESLSLSAIRTIRVLRPLRAINRVPSIIKFFKLGNLSHLNYL
jgi:hypothetical protein